MISAVDRLRLKPWVAVEQNWQLSAQPTCDDTHSVPRPLSGMNTASMALLPSMPSSHLWVPSVEGFSNWTCGTRTSACASSLARSTLPRSEEHTSELQSLMRISYDVFCLKKKKKQTTI